MDNFFKPVVIVLLIGILVALVVIYLKLPVPAPWLGDLVNFSGILIGAYFIIYQLKRQHKNSMELQAEDYRNKYRLKIYNEFSETLNKTMKDSAEVMSEINNTCNEFSLQLKLINSGEKSLPIENKQIFEVSNLFFDTQILIYEIIFLIEKYEIVIPEFRIFINAIISINSDLRDSFIDFKDLLFKIKPYDKIKILENSVDCYTINDITLTGYLYDLQNELQNKLLRKLFNNEVLKRNPTDSNIKVITTDVNQLENLTKYFEEKNKLRESKKRNFSNE